MRASDVDPAPSPEAPAPEYRRSVGALERQGRNWACDLVVFARGDVWRGGFAFVPADPAPEEGELRTATIFVEDSQAEIHAKARSMGRPLLEALLDSLALARERGLLTIVDVKRSDIGSTATAYADAFLGDTAAQNVEKLNILHGIGVLYPRCIDLEIPLFCLAQGLYQTK